jgi:RimJ/RimL family protein N-acetyltransferase
MGNYLLFVQSSHQEPAPITLDPALSYEFWRPSLFHWWPAGLFRFPLLVWALFHYLGVFTNRRYAIFLIRHGAEIVHYSGVYPGYFRFPFMVQEDLQIGDTWTSVSWRNRGLAQFAVQKIVEAAASSVRNVWYVCDEENVASVRVIEKCGFRCVGRLERTKLLGLRVFGQYQLFQEG